MGRRVTWLLLCLGGANVDAERGGRVHAAQVPDIVRTLTHLQQQQQGLSLAGTVTDQDPADQDPADQDPPDQNQFPGSGSR